MLTRRVSLETWLGLAVVLSAFSNPARAQQAPRCADALYDFDRCFLPSSTTLAGYFSSYDRTGGNDDGFKGTWSALYARPDGEQVIVDLQGPGCLYTLWFTGPTAGYHPSWGQLRFYLDDEPSPRPAPAGVELYRGEVPGFPRPLVADSTISTGGDVCYVPIPFRKRLVIATEKRVEFYNAFYHLYPPGTPVESWTPGQDLAPVIRAWNAVGSNPPAQPNRRLIRQRIDVRSSRRSEDAAMPEVLNVQGAGVIRALRINPAGPLSAFALNNLWLRIFWDGEDSPSVDVPVGPFFGSGQGEASVRSLLIGMSASGPYYCHFPMPFARGARIVLDNRQQESLGEFFCEVELDEMAEAALPPGAGRFHARYRREQPAERGRDFVLLDVEAGQGTYLGHTLIVDPYDPANKQWWEGDLRIWTDRRRHPILHGTGHEDELLGGWSSRWLRGPYSLPLHGLPSVRLFPERADSQWNGAMSGYRFFPGGIPFRDGIRVSTEHGMNNVVVTNYAAVAYYYARPEPAMVLSDTLEIGHGASESAHGYGTDGAAKVETATARFDADDWRPGAEPLTRSGRRGQTAETFTLRINRGNRGVLLRRLYLSDGSRHRARLFVDDQPAGMLSAPEGFNLERWREQDVILPASVTGGKESIGLRIEVVEGRLNAFGYWAYSLTSR